MRHEHNNARCNIGKTLNLQVTTIQRTVGAPSIMSSLVAQFARLFASAPTPHPSSPAAALIESADLRAGVDAHHAQELRVAACAWLRVIR